MVELTQTFQTCYIYLIRSGRQLEHGQKNSAIGAGFRVLGAYEGCWLVASSEHSLVHEVAGASVGVDRVGGPGAVGTRTTPPS